MSNCRYTLYIIIVTFILAGCQGEGRYHSRLCALDSVLVQSPDSVYKVLVAEEKKAQQQSRSDRMYYELLRADAQNKAYIDFTTDSVMLQVADYYDHHGTANQQMRAHYLLGCTYRDLGDAPMELQCFQEAVEKADTTQQDCDLYTLAAIYGQMADIYHSQFLPEEELNVLDMCERTDWMNKDTLSALNSQSLRIRAFELLNMNDSILSTTQYLFNKYVEIGETGLAAKILGTSINIYINSNDYDKAAYLANYYKEESKKFDHASPSYYMMNYNLGLLSLHDKNYSTAEQAFRLLIQHNELEAGYRGLLELYQELHISDSIAKYAKLFANANDSSYIGKNSEIIAQMTAMYDYSRHQQIAKQKTIESAKSKNLVYIISMVTALILFSAILVFGYLRNKSKENERRYQIQEKTLLKRYNETKQKIAILEQDLSSLETLKEEVSSASSTQIEQLLNTISNYEKEKEELVIKLKRFNQINDDLDFKAWYEDFIECNAAKKLHAKTIVTPNLSVTIEDKIWDELSAQILSHCPDFLNMINSYSLNQVYQHIVILNVFDFSTGEIAILLNKTVQQISNIHNRISKKIFPSSTETRKLKQNLLEILRNKRLK